MIVDLQKCQKLIVDLLRSWKLISTVTEDYVNYCLHEPALVLKDEETLDYLSPVELYKRMP